MLVLLLLFVVIGAVVDVAIGVVVDVVVGVGVGDDDDDVLLTLPRSIKKYNAI